MFRIDARLHDSWRKFRQSRFGGVLIYVAFGLPLLVGAMALSIDLGRSFILNSELKDFSDAAALAGAAELDGRDGARAAAEQAARSGLDGTLINIQAFATDGGGPTMAIDQVVFLRQLPADGTNFTVDDTATSDQDARFIFVSVVERSVRSGLSRGLGAIPDFTSRARSIAGFSSVTCRIPALWMCNPLEDPDFPVADPGTCTTGPGVPLVGQEHCLTGRQTLMKKGGGGAAYVPGNFGLLDCPSGFQGTNCVAPFVAAAAPSYCVSNTVDFRTGQAMGPIQSAINTRFDMYDNPMFGKEEDNPEYRPAMNVVKGFTGTGCSSSAESDPTVAHAFPRDTCFATQSCAGGNRWGTGDWNQETYDHDGDPGTPNVEPYWAVNHPGAAPPFGYAQMTRHEVYRHEIANDPGPQGIPDNSPAGENGHPQCYSGGTMSDPTLDADDTGLDEIDRRVMVMAAVNCVENAPLNGNESGVPVVGFVEVFLTEPAWGQGNEKANIYGELKGILTPGESEAVHDIVQLYR